MTKDPRVLVKRGLRVCSFRPTNLSFTPFIVLCRSRTGSNLLISYLNSHLRVAAYGELCMRRNGRSVQECVEPAFGSQPPHVRASGLKVFYDHPLDDHSDELWDFLAAKEDLAVIHLTRKNMLRTAISRRRAGMDRAWLDHGVGRSTRFFEAPVSMSGEELRDVFVYTEEMSLRRSETLARHPSLLITYEELTTAPRRTMERVFSFLGLSYARPSTTLRKQNQLGLRESLANYDKLKEYFKDTRWVDFFEE